MLKRLTLSNTKRDPLIPFRNAHHQARDYRNDMPMPERMHRQPSDAASVREVEAAADEVFDMDATLDLLFGGGQQAESRNRLEEWADWLSENVGARSRRTAMVEEQAG